MLNLGHKSQSPSSDRSLGAVVSERHQAPHPIPAGMEGSPCPITGLFADGIDAKQVSASALTALEELRADPDISEERVTFCLKRQEDQESTAVAQQHGTPVEYVPLNVINRAHKANQSTKMLVRSIGGLPTLRRFTTIFYQRCFAD